MDNLNDQTQLSDDYISTLEGSKGIFEKDQKEISVLLHPIQNCPEDILRIIFDYAARADGDKLGSFKAATAISHVCKIWRAVTLRMRSLWTTVSISMKDNIEDTSLFVERTRARLGTTPADIIIKNIGECPIELMKEMMESIELHKFKAISNLNYSIKESGDLVHLTTLIQLSTCTSVENVWVTQDTPPEEEECPDWDGTCILVQFPSLTYLLIDIAAYITFSNPETYTNLRMIEFRGHPSVWSFTPQVLRFPELTDLEIIEFSWDLQTHFDDIILPKLRYLLLWNVRNVPWSKISTPCLERMITTNGIADETIEFFCRHPSISVLECYIESKDELFKRLARCLANLESLNIDYSPKGLYSKIDSTVPFPLFPKLKKLVIDNRRNKLSLSEFEAFVRDRFLSQGTNDLATLTSWVIYFYGKDIDEYQWYRSALMDHLHVKEEMLDEWIDFRCLTLTLK